VRLHREWLQLLIRAARFDGLMLARIANDHHASVAFSRWINSFICFVLARLDSSRT
jgi:hypothetical protein